jgi:hypothetical protein
MTIIIAKYANIFHSRTSKKFLNWDFWYYANKASGNPVPSAGNGGGGARRKIVAAD